MIIILTGIILFLVCVLAFVILRNRKNLAYVNTILSAECRSISDGLSQLAYGNLNAHCDVTGTPANTSLGKLTGDILRIKKDFNDVTLEPLRRVCYVGSDSFLEGQKATQTLAESCHETGEVAVVITVSLNSRNNYRFVQELF